MKPSTSLSLGAVAALAGAGTAAADSASYDTIAPIQIHGKYFFDSKTGDRFYMKGVDYQEEYSGGGSANKKRSATTYVDPLSNKAKCQRDVKVLQSLSTNTIRTYAIDPKANHDDCMEIFASAGIYIVSDLSSPDISIDSNDPSWDMPLYQRYTAVVDSLAKYKNVIGFFAGNEVVSAANQTASAAYVKAAVRDTKSYILSKKYRSSLGVGYATADVATRDQLAHYFACESDKSGNGTAIDFWGYNVYSWCGDSSYEKSKYGERVDFFKDYPVPVFYAEYGCNEGLPGGPYTRPFTEVAALFGKLMTDVFSGGLVYSYFNGVNQYGLVNVSDTDPVTKNPDFASYSRQINKVKPTSLAMSAYKPSNSAPACPTVDASWAAKATPLPPVVNSQLCDCEMASLSCNVESTDTDKYSKVFGYVCGLDDGKYCEGITGNSTTGKYGALSMCSAKDQLGWAINQYYLEKGNSEPSACSFKGVATTQAASTADSCTSVVSAVGTAGTGSVSATAGADASSSGNAAHMLGTPAFFDYGKAFFVAYAFAAFISGVGMIIL